MPSRTHPPHIYIYTALASRTLWSNVSAYTHGKQHHTQMFVLARLLVRSLACLLKPNDIYLSKNLNFHHSLNHLNTICGYIHDCLASLCSLFAVFVVIAAMKLWIDWYVLLCVMVLSYSRCMVISRNVFICSFAVAIQCTQHTRAHCVESQPTNHRNCRLFLSFWRRAHTRLRTPERWYFSAFKSPFSYISVCSLGFFPLPKTIFICAHFIGPLHFEVDVVSSYNNITWFYPQPSSLPFCFKFFYDNLNGAHGRFSIEKLSYANRKHNESDWNTNDAKYGAAILWEIQVNIAECERWGERIHEKKTR